MNRQANAATWIEPTSLLCVCLLAFAPRTNAQPAFNVQSIQQTTNGSVTITWPVVQPTGTYYVAYANSPAGPWQVFTNGTIVAGPLATSLAYTDSAAATVPQRFYKIVLGRAPVILTLVLERDYAMTTTMGDAYLSGAVTDFVNDFSDNYDQAAMLSYGTIATTDVALSNVFRTAISTATSNLQYAGGSFAVAGLVLASNQVASAAGPPGQTAIRVVVFFNDNVPNMIEQTLSCPPSSPWIFGGYDVGDGNYVGFWPTNTTISGQNTPTCALANGGAPSCCPGQNYFVTIDGAHETFLRSNVTAEAQAETLSLANAMEANGWYVYCLGLNANPFSQVSPTFLCQVANDPRSPTYNSSLPTGSALVVTNAADLDQAFQSIAAMIPPL